MSTTGLPLPEARVTGPGPESRTLPISRAFFDRPAPAVARDLIGWDFRIAGIGGVIVETEAYTRDDEASHSFRGPRTANAAMFGPPATAYVYRIYGLHRCLNFVCRDAGAVLIRALEPVSGLKEMAERRALEDARLLCSGPGRLAQALGVGLGLNGASLLEEPFALLPPQEASTVVTGLRIGISRAVDRPWRFGRHRSRFLSKPFPPDATVVAGKRPLMPRQQEGESR